MDMVLTNPTSRTVDSPAGIHPCIDSLPKSDHYISGNFKNQDIHSNPSSLTGTFAYYRLFDALYKKQSLCIILQKRIKRRIFAPSLTLIKVLVIT